MNKKNYYLLVTASDRMGGSPSMDYIEESEISENMLDCSYYSIYKKIDKKEFPNSSDGDMLKQVKKEIEYLQDVLEEISAITQWNWDTMSEEGRKNCLKLIGLLATEALKN
jgi:hypothetical protein